MNPAKHSLTRIIFSALNDIEEWKLGDPALAAAKGYPREYPAEMIDDWGMVFVDVTLDAATGDTVCHEVNGPNAVGSDALTGDSRHRAENELQQAMHYARNRGYLNAGGRLITRVVTIHAHQHWKYFRTGGEFYPRVQDFAELAQGCFPGHEVRCRGASETLGDESLAVVMGDVPSVAANLRVDPATHRFEYQGRPVIFIGNPNLVPELVRTRKLRYDGRRVLGTDMRVFHAWRLVPIVLDKAVQQQLLRGTGLRPLRFFEANSQDEALVGAKQLLRYGPVVIKPNGASGGAGVHVVVPGMSDDDIRTRIMAVSADCFLKYGENAEEMAFPLRGFEFARSTGYPMPDGERLWDLCIAVLFEPGKAKVYPVSMRLTRLPFDENTFHLERDQWISNVSGRRDTLLKSGMDDKALAAVGMTPAKLEEAFRASVRWTLKAWDSSIRDGGCKGTVYEDDCESEDPLFYPWDKFSSWATT